MADKIIAAAREAGFVVQRDEWVLQTMLRTFYAIARAEALEDAARVVEARRAYESSAAAHHAGNWQPAFEFHTTRHAAMVDALESIRALMKEKDHG